MNLFTFAGLAALLDRLLVLGVDVLDVLPDEAFGVLEILTALTQDVGRGEGRRHLDAALEVVPLATVLGDPEVLVYDGLGGGASEAEDDLRLYSLDLALQVGVAGFDLASPRLAGLVNRREDIVEQLARPPDERQPRGVLVLTRPLADEHQRRVWVAGAEDG